MSETALPADPLVGQATGQESSLSSWAGPYVTDMLGRGQALAQTPYEAYTGPLTAGFTGAQESAFGGIAGLTIPDSIGQAAQTAGDVASAAGGMGYTAFTPTNQYQAPRGYTAGNITSQYQAPRGYTAGNITSQYQAPQGYTAGNITSQYQAPQGYTAGNITSQYQAPQGYTAGDISTGAFDTAAAQQYMNPYLQAALEPQLAEARRQAEIARVNQAGRLTRAGAFGGGRQAIMESELERNVLRNLADITGTGYGQAYDRAQQAFTQDQARALQAQQLQEQARQAQGAQALTDAAQRAQFGQSAQQLQEQARQAQGAQALTDAAQRAQFGQSAQQLREAARQAQGAQALTDAAQQAQFGQSAQQLREAARQAQGAQALTGAAQRAQFGQSAQQLREAARQAQGAQALTRAAQQAQYGQAAQQLGEQSRQFGAGFGLDALARQLQAAQAQGQLGQMGLQGQLNLLGEQARLGGLERGINQEAIDAARRQFEEERLFPYRQIQFEQSLLQGLPLAAQNITYQQPGFFSELSGGTSGILGLLRELGFGGGGGGSGSGSGGGAIDESGAVDAAVEAGVS